MKKLLLLINLIIFFLVSCHQPAELGQTSVSEAKSSVKDSVSVVNNTAPKVQEKASGETEKIDEKVKGTNTVKQNEDKAIIHLSSNQAKTDSIKQAKLKGKK